MEESRFAFLVKSLAKVGDRRRTCVLGLIRFYDAAVLRPER